MKSLQTKQQGLRTRLRNNQAEIQRLMVEYENFGAIVVNGDFITDERLACHQQAQMKSVGCWFTGSGRKYTINGW
jgi:hypothetical protein